MPSAAEILGRRRVKDLVGQRFGVTPMTYNEHGYSQIVLEIVSDLGGQRVAVNVSEAKIITAEEGKGAIVDNKIQTKVINLQETEVR